jgi:hypothetical protein
VSRNLKGHVYVSGRRVYGFRYKIGDTGLHRFAPHAAQRSPAEFGSNANLGLGTMAVHSLHAPRGSGWRVR